MLGRRSPQRGMFEADHVYSISLDGTASMAFWPPSKGIYFGTRTSVACILTRALRTGCPDNGRNSVPPSLLATALLLQAHDRVSDDEAKARADFDMRWKVALGIGMDQRPSPKAPCSCSEPSSSCMTGCGQYFNAAWNTPRRQDT